MSWLRLDDRFARHPKIRRLSVQQRWAWLELLLYCAEYRTGGIVPADIAVDVPMATPALLERCAELGLLDVEGDVVRVHDWNAYNGAKSGAERTKAWRERQLGDEMRDERVTDGDDDVTERDVTSRARLPSRTLRDVDPLSTSTATSRPRARGSGWVDNLNSYTGVRLIRGTHSMSAVYDPLGTEPAPADWPHARPTKQEILEALKQREGVAS